MGNTDSIYQVFLNTSISFIVLLFLTRTLGKKQMSQLTFFNYITGISIGSIAGNMVDLEWNQFKVTIWGLVWWVFLTYIVSVIALNMPKIGTFLHGQPTIVIKKGKIQYKAMKHLNVDLDNLSMLLREKDVFSYKDVDYAILETDGQLTVIKHPELDNVTKKDMKIDVKVNTYLPMEIIVDGKLIVNNLKEVGLTKSWVDKQLRNQKIKNIKDVLYAQLQSNGTLHIDEKEIK